MHGACVCSTAAKYGQLGAMKWLLAYGFPWGTYMCSNAAYNVYLSILQWAKTNGCPLMLLKMGISPSSDGRERMDVRGTNLRVPLLQWARDNGCPWDTSMISKAAENGHLSVLQWARENGCRSNKCVLMLLVGVVIFPSSNVRER